MKKKEYNFTIQLLIDKLDFDMIVTESFVLFDYRETIDLNLLGKKLDDFYETTKEKIKEIKLGKLKMKKKTNNFKIQLVLSKLEFDGNTIEPFVLFDYQEAVVNLNLLNNKLDDFYKKGMEKIKEIKDILKRD